MRSVFAQSPPSPLCDKNDCAPSSPLTPPLPLTYTPFWTIQRLSGGSLWRPLYGGYVRFCRRQCFVDANILLTPMFCLHQCFVNANVLSAPMFCRRQCFVGANVLSVPMFCHRQYFVAANILSALRFKDDYLLNILLKVPYCPAIWTGVRD